MRDSWLRSAVVVILCLLWGSVTAVAEDGAEPKTPEQAAARVREAHAAGDLEALDRTARRRVPDPFETLRVLLYDGRFDAAEAFATHVPEVARGKMPAEVAAWRAAPESRRVQSQFAEVLGLVARREGAAARAVLDAIEPLRDSSRVLVAYYRAAAISQSEDMQTSMQAFATCERLATALGWWHVATRAAQYAAREAVAEAAWVPAIENFLHAVDSSTHATPLGTQVLILVELADTQFLAVRHAPAVVTATSAVQLARRHALVPEELYALKHLGAIESRSGRAEGALASHQRMVALAQSVQNLRAEIEGLIAVSGDLMDLGQHAVAGRRLARVLELTAQPGFEVLRSEALRQLGRVHALTGAFAPAIQRTREALTLARRARDAHATAASLHALGQLLGLVGESEAAIASLKESLALKQALGDPVDIAGTLASLAAAYRMQGDLGEAMRHAEAAIESQLAQHDTHGLRLSLTLRARIHAHLGQHEGALADFAQALALMRQAGDVAGEAWALWGLGWTRLRMGRTREAHARLAEARAQFERLGDRMGLVHADHGLARVFLLEGNPKRALQAVDRAQQMLRVVQRGLEDEQIISTRSPHAALTQYGLEAAALLDDPAALFRILESGRAGALLEAIGGRGVLPEERLPGDVLAAEQAARQADARAQQELALALGRGDKPAVETARRALAAARRRMDTAISQMERDAPKAAALVYPKPIALGTFRKLLAPDEAYVAFEFSAGSGYALVVSRGRTFFHKWADAAEIRATIESLRFDAPPALNRDGLQKLRALLVDPLKLAPEIRRVLVSPTGALAWVPFTLLWPGRELVYVPSASTLVRLQQRRARRGTGVLAVGDPAYPDGAVANGVPLRRLPYSGEEAAQVGDVVLRGKQASEANVRAALRRRQAWRAFHLACHAVMSPEAPRRSALALSPDATSDGRLTVDDVFGMTIPADLVVLSACESGGGAVRGSEGIVGFTRAFFFAGASRVLVSLWVVDDEATSALMRKFYELWQARPDGSERSAAAALREAQAWVRGHDRWKHPYYWAAWTLWGVPD